jgi:1,2-diacylglycerol 3-alpha-glucosyltransferase
MNIWMMTNTFTPFVGGVARSVVAFAGECRRAGHRVVIVAPMFEGMPVDEEDVIRVPALQNFNGSDFSLALPAPGILSSRLEECRPDIVHSHHPHLLGNTAVRIACRLGRPLVFTHHTRYEHYIHYVPTGASRLREFVIALVTGYCNLCDCVIAPSLSIALILQERGVQTPIEVVPTGVDIGHFAHGDGSGFRHTHRIPQSAFVVGYVGRLAPEKNLPFLAKAVSAYLTRVRGGHFLVAGSGPSAREIREIFSRAGLRRCLHLVGALDGQDLVNAYHAMDVFAFASCSETQGMVLTEAMAAGKPIVALDGPGIREAVVDGYNGRLLGSERVDDFAAALGEIGAASPLERRRLAQAAREMVEQFSLERCGRRLLQAYDRLVQGQRHGPRDESVWHHAMEEIKAEWELLKNMAGAVGQAMKK